MMRPALVLLAVALAALCGCESKQAEVDQSRQVRVEPVMEVARLQEGVYEVRCELRTSEPSKSKEISRGQRLILHPDKPGQILMYSEVRLGQSSRRFLRFLLEVTVKPTDHPQKVRVTYLFLMATTRGIRFWQGSEVEWMVGEARVLPEEFPPPATAPTATR